MLVKVFNLGLVDYQKAREFQKEVFSEVRNGNLKSALIFCRHYPVITLGRKTGKKNILLEERELNLKGIKLYETERGGDVTYHGPGQLTVYPIFNLDYYKKDIHWFLRYLEETVINLLADFGVKGRSLTGLTGVWINKQKICSIGIAIKNWITFHGLSLNIKKNDLDNFLLIRPCGMDIEMAALETVLGRDIEIDNVKKRLINIFRDA